MDLPLGYYYLIGKEGSSWRFSAIDPFSDAEDIPMSREDTVMPTHASMVPAVPSSREREPSDGDEGPPPRRIRHDEPSHQPSLHFLVGGTSFDSLLECIHCQAFRALRLQYQPTRHQFDLAGILPGARKHYTLDGSLYVRIGSCSAPLSIVHVEIKPGPFTVEESELCYALCRLQAQNVLCIFGGVVEHRSDVALRERPFVEMQLYESTGVHSEPIFWERMIWRWTHPDDEPYLSPSALANPRMRIVDEERLRAVYGEATVEARRLAAQALARVRGRA